MTKAELHFVVVESQDNRGNCNFAVRLINPHGCSHNRFYFKSRKDAENAARWLNQLKHIKGGEHND